jgi:hypothetical protein
MRFILLQLVFVAVAFTFAMKALGQSSGTTQGTDAASAKAKGPVPVTMVECEGVNNCATWTFLGSQGNGKWPSGEEANLTVEKYDNDSVVIHRADSTGSDAGLTAVYNGTRHGDNVGGEFTSNWPGHWENKTGNWYATVSKAAPPLPSVMHFCAANCKTLVLDNGRYTSPADPGTATWTVAHFTSDLVVIDRVDTNGYSAHYKGQISQEGDRLIHAVRDSRPFTEDWSPGPGTSYDSFSLVWGAALNTLPGSGPPPGQPAQAPVVVAPIVVAPAVCIPWFFTVICG